MCLRQRWEVIFALVPGGTYSKQSQTGECHEKSCKVVIICAECNL